MSSWSFGGDGQLKVSPDEVTDTITLCSNSVGVGKLRKPHDEEEEMKPDFVS